MKTLKDLISEAHELVPKISCSELNIDLDQYMILDVREKIEIDETGSLPNSINIPRGLIEMKMAPDDNSLKAETPIVVYCGGGSRASLAGKTLQELGFKNVKNLEGGFRGWAEFVS
tara:strand:+ start:114 stop:461 length:348 start_codon:yes stop_codon:yes gene_type:complete